YQRNLLRWIKLAKTPQTRAKRIEKIAVRAAKNQKIPQM
ncbi:MAG: YdeI/OmpD-associated family protein, partial [Cyanobacteria bacterium P01_H01_bin.119]